MERDAESCHTPGMPEHLPSTENLGCDDVAALLWYWGRNSKGHLTSSTGDRIGFSAS